MVQNHNEDKVDRRGLRVGDLFCAESFAAKLKEIVEYHNFSLVNYYKAEPVNYEEVLADALSVADIIKNMTADISEILDQARKDGESIMFEGAQGTLLDIDHGTYPYVTSSNTTAGGVATGCGVGPRHLDYILGITKAYTTRVGSGPFPTELDDEVGNHLGTVGHEFGATTGRERRCGWFDAVAMHRAIQVNSVTGFCLTKLDVLDGLETLKICTGYKTLEGDVITVPPTAAEGYEKITPIYEELPGWTESTVGATSVDALPANALAYIKRIEEITGIPVDIISTGPDRVETIIKVNPFL